MKRFGRQGGLVGVDVQIPGRAGAFNQIEGRKALGNNGVDFVHLSAIVLWVLPTQVCNGVDALLGGFVQQRAGCVGQNCGTFSGSARSFQQLLCELAICVGALIMPMGFIRAWLRGLRHNIPR